MVLSGFDSAFGPTLPVAQQARSLGNTFWLGYLGGPGVYHAWTASDWAVLRQAGLTPGCLWVPTFGLAEDPAAAARAAVGVAESRGLFGAVMLDTEEQMSTSPNLVSYVDGFCAQISALGRTPVVYDGAHYVPAGVYAFHVNWGSSTYPVSGQAVQYGPAVRFGMSVDVDLADTAFPLASWNPPDPPPHPDPPPVPQEEPEMLLIRNATSGQYASTDGAHKVVIREPATVTAYTEAGVKTANIPADDFAAIPNAT